VYGHEASHNCLLFYFRFYKIHVLSHLFSSLIPFLWLYLLTVQYQFVWAQSFAQCLCNFLFFHVLRRNYVAFKLLLPIFIFHSVSVALLINSIMLVCMGAKLCAMSRWFLGHLCSEKVLWSTHAFTLTFIFHSISVALLINCTILVCMGVKLGTKSRQCLDRLHSEEVLWSMLAIVAHFYTLLCFYSFTY
jgi:hypothetical protein